MWRAGATTAILYKMFINAPSRCALYLLPFGAKGCRFHRSRGRGAKKTFIFNLRLSSMLRHDEENNKKKFREKFGNAEKRTTFAPALKQHVHRIFEKQKKSFAGKVKVCIFAVRL